MRARVAGGVVLGILLGAVAHPGSAAAQQPPLQKGFALNRYEPSERGSEWFALDSLDLRGKIRPAIGITGDYGYHPLVAYDRDGNYITAVVRQQLFVDPSASLVLWDRLRLAALVPVGVYEDGHSITTATNRYKQPGGALGDIRLGADARVFGTHGDAVTGALGGALWIPTGTRKSYESDGNTRFAPRFTVAGDVSYFTYSAKAAFQYRPLTEKFDRNHLGSEIELGAAAGVRLLDEKLVVGPEVWASTVTNDDFFKRRGTPVEGLLGAHYTAIHDLRFGAGVGMGLLRGWGSPAFRALLSAEWAPGFEKPDPLPPPPPVVVEPPPPPIVVEPPPPPPPPDRDADGVIDAKDACPDVPGDASTDAMSNGCPADRDGDGIYDKDDACPDSPGAADPTPKKNGCPLARVEDGQIKIAEQFLFKTNSAKILGESEMTLRAIASTLKRHPEITKVRVEGNTDNVGSASDNLVLSQKRAEAIVAELVKFGVSKTRLSAKGMGASNPLQSNLTEEGRADNRRVELKIVESKPK